MSMETCSGLLQMPIAFGSAAGPRRLPPEGSGFVPGPTKAKRFGARFLTERASLQALLPPGLEVNGEPLVNVEFVVLREIAWLAGRGYNLVSVRIPVVFDGVGGRKEGQYLAVVWENRAEPIITGREQLGWPKIHAELPDPISMGDVHRAHAEWDKHRFLTLELDTPKALEGGELAFFLDPARAGVGAIVHKYIPRTGHPWSDADANYLTLGPSPGEGNEAKPKDAPIPLVKVGTGTATFHHAMWSQMPTQFHIVNALADLPQLEARGAWMVESLEYNAWHDQVILS